MMFLTWFKRWKKEPLRRCVVFEAIKRLKLPVSEFYPELVRVETREKAI